MKILSVIICLCILTVSFPVYAEEGAEVAGTAGESATITVKGLVCEFCVKNIEKVLSKQKEIAGVSIDLGKAEVTVTFKKGQTMDDVRIKELIKDAGYDVDSISREYEDEGSNV